MKVRFATVFLCTFTVLLVLWGTTGFARGYRVAALWGARVLSPALTGWWLELSASGDDPGTFRKGSQRILLQIDPGFLSIAQVPLAALIVATPGLGVGQVVIRVLLGMGIFFLIHLAVLLLYPVVLATPNLLTDTVGVFSGLLSFVLAPQLLWFVLTYDRLRALWQLEGASVRREAKGGDGGDKRERV